MTTSTPWVSSRAATQSKFKLPGNLPQWDRAFSANYRLDSGTVDVKLARNLYNNIEPMYKLGAGFSRPAVNVPVGFMGVPILRPSRTDTTENSEAADWLKRLVPQWSGDIIRIHQAALLDGECLVRLRPANRSPGYQALFTPDDKDLELTYEPAEAYEILYKDEDLGALEGIRVKHIFMIEEAGTMVEKALYETVTSEKIVLEYEGNYRPKRTLPNTLGFVPAVHIKNESYRHQLRGRSELEPLEPYMKFYHDVMLHAGSASKLHSTAKLMLRVQDVERFLANNFTESEVTEGVLRFNNKDVLFFESGSPEIGITGASAYTEGAEIIQANAPLGDTNTLLEYIFLNIVDVSEVPEWAFGGAIASSKASVTEQSAPLVHKVNRKRKLFENHWALVGRMALKMLGISSRVEVVWDDLNQRDTKSEAEGLKFLAEALVTLNDAEIVSKITAAEELRPHMKNLLPYAFDNSREEQARIDEEIEAKADAAVAQLEEEGPQLEEQDREAGIRAIG